MNAPTATPASANGGEHPSLTTIFAPVRSQTAFEETLERLGTAIKLGLLEPGSRLPAERELCGRLGIARSTLRQALTALVQSGHLRAVRGRGGGTFVATGGRRSVRRAAGRLARGVRRAPGGRARRRRACVRARHPGRSRAAP
jgi:DNA-binding transcriptional regulator YhcF (GntR family)